MALISGSFGVVPSFIWHIVIIFDLLTASQILESLVTSIYKLQSPFTGCYVIYILDFPSPLLLYLSWFLVVNYLVGRSRA